MKILCLVSLFIVFNFGCAPQSDVGRLQKDLEAQISKIKVENMALASQVDETKAQLIKMNVEAQKTRGNLASINQKVTLLQELQAKDVASLYGKLEETEKSINDLRKDFTNETGLLKSEVHSKNDPFSIKTQALEVKESKGKVIHITDGDTITVLNEAKEEVKLRLNGIDCPEPDQVYGKEATEFTKNLVLGLKVLIRPSKKEIRQTVADVILEDGRNLSQELIKAGYAWWSFENSTDELLAHLESKAKIEKVGLWANPDPIPPWIFRQQLKSSIQKLPSSTPIPFEPDKKLTIPEKIQSQYGRKSIGQKCYNAVVTEPHPFLGNGGEMVVLDDGTIWKEVSYQYLYLYEYYPNVIVCPSTGEMTLGEHVFEIVQVN